jgi:hypothetical protein
MKFKLKLFHEKFILFPRVCDKCRNYVFLERMWRFKTNAQNGFGTNILWPLFLCKSCAPNIVLAKKYFSQNKL